MKQDLLELEKKAGYQFHDRRLLERAMTHKSYINEAHMEKYESNERLEFLGDAVLELVTSEYLFQDEAKFPEGELTRMRASIVCEPALAFCARQLDLGGYLRLGKGEEATGGRNRDSLTSDALEALIARSIWMVVLLTRKSLSTRWYSATWRVRSSFSIARLSFRRLCRPDSGISG